MIKIELSGVITLEDGTLIVLDKTIEEIKGNKVLISLDDNLNVEVKEDVKN